MAIKFSQFNLRTDHTSGMYLVGYDGNQNIHITVDNLFNDFINGTENTITMFGAGGTVLADSILSQDAGAAILTVAGQLNVDAAATFDTNITVTGDSTLNGNVTLGNASTDSITQTGTLYLNGPVKDTTDTLGAVDQVLLSDAAGELTFTDLSDLHVGGAEVVEVSVKNVQGSALVKGDPVYISGSVGASGRLEVQLADASNTLKMPAVGLLKQDLANNAEGFAVVTGKLRNLITDPIDGVNPTENDVIYVKPSGTSGAALTTTKPVYGNFIQNVGKVGRVSTSNDGNFVVSSILRTNDIPNLTPGRLWIGSTGNTIESQTIFVDEAAGEVGIGTTSPGKKLDVNGDAILRGQLVIDGDSSVHSRINQTSSYLEIVGNNTDPTDGARMWIGTGQTDQEFYINALNHSFRDTSSNTRMVISGSTGNVGIGTTNPAAKLDVSGNNGTAIRISIPQSSPSLGDVLSSFETFSNDTSGGLSPSVRTSVRTITEDVYARNMGLSFGTSGGDGENLERMRIDSSGKVGIGTANPSRLFHIDSGTSTAFFRFQGGGGFGEYTEMYNNGNDFLLRADATGGATSSGHINFAVGTTDGAQIGGSGQVTFWQYGSGTFTGTAAKNLAVDSSGNVIETDGGIIDGSGTANYVSKWSDANTLTDSQIFDNGTNVGIGTTSPSEKLDVRDGTITSRDSGNVNYAELDRFSGLTLKGNGAGAKYISTPNTDALGFKTNNTEKMRIDSSGRVGIGRTPTSNLLEVADTIKLTNLGTSEGFVGFNTNGQKIGITTVDAVGAGMKFEVGASERMRIQSDGNVGIGTSNPNARLHVYNTGNAEIEVERASGALINIQAQSAKGVIGTDSNHTFSLKTNSTERLTVLTSGNVGIGTTSPSVTLEANGIIRSDRVGVASQYVQIDGGNAGGPFITAAGVAKVLTIQNNSTTSSDIYFNQAVASTYQFKQAAVTKMIIDSSGNVGIGTTSPQSLMHQHVSDSGINYHRFTNSATGVGGSDGFIIGIGATEHGVIWNYEEKDLIFGTASTERLRIDSSGNVGIGTTSPDVKLEVVEASPTDGIIADFVNSTNAEGTTAAIKLSNSDSEVCDVILGANRVGANFGSDFFISLSDSVDGSNQERFRITEAGNVGIGATSPTQKLHVDGNARVTGAYYDSANSPGTGGQVLTSTATGTDWIDPTLLPAESAEKVIQSVRMGEAVSKGDPLVITGYHGSNGPAIVERADATNSTYMPAYGVALEDYANNATGLMIAVGDFNDFDTSGYSVGDTLYVAVGGGMTNVKPTGTALIQNMGIVSRSNANNGDVEIVAIGRTNDVPNLPEGRLFVGTSGNTSLTSDVVYIDDANDRVGIGTTSPSAKLHVQNGRLLIDTNTPYSSGIWMPDTNGNPSLRIVTDQSAAHYSSIINAWNNSSNSGIMVGSTRNDGTAFQVRSGVTLTSGFANDTGNTRFIVNGNGNVGIGTTSPSVPLEVSGVSTTSGNGEGLRVTRPGVDSQYISIDEADGSKHRIRAIGNKPFDIFSSATLYGLNFHTNSIERMRITEAGNVGIGTTSPDAKLEIKTDGEVNSFIKLNSTRGTGNIYGLKTNGGNSDVLAIMDITAGNRLAAIGQSEISFATGGTTRLLINSSGNVGIGTTSPAEKLHVEGNIYLGAPASGTRTLYTGGDSDLHLQTNTGDVKILSGFGANNLMTLLSTGNVGIGTTSPVAKLHIEGDGSIIRLQNNNSDNNGTFIDFRDSSGTRTGYVGTTNNSDDMFLLTQGAKPIRFFTSATERMRIDSSGNVGIGTTSPNRELSIGDGTGSPNIQLLASTVGNSRIEFGDTDDTDAGEIQYVHSSNYMQFTTNGTEKMRIDSSGNVGIGTPSTGSKLTVNGRISATSEINAGGTGYEIGGQGIANFISGVLTLGDWDDNYFTTRIMDENAVEVMRVTNGRVGIGTPNPSQKLDVVGSIEVSNGIYLGGTAAANHLDDYEEGIYNPEFFLGTGSTAYDSSDFSNFTNYSKYVKVGRKVTIYLSITYTGVTTAISTSTMTLGLGNFPFTPARTDFCTGTYSFLYYERPNATTIPQTYGWNGVLDPAFLGPVFSSKVKLRKLIYNSFFNMWSPSGITGNEFPRSGPFGGSNYFTAVIHYYTND